MTEKEKSKNFLPKWVQEKHEENIKTQEDFLTKKYLNLKTGTQTIWINVDEIPLEIEGSYGKRYQYKAKSKPEEEDRILSVSKVLDRLIVEILATGKNPVEITRIGEGKNTRWVVA